MMSIDPFEKRPQSHDAGLTGEHPLGDIGQLVGLVGFLILWTLDSFVFHMTTVLAAFVPLPIRLAACGLLLAVALRVALSGHRAVFGRSSSGSRIIREGVFARVRHPLYFCSLLFYLGLCLASFSLVSLVLFLGLLAFYNAIAAYEEQLLVARFGQEYRDYQTKVRRFVPRIKPARFE